MSINEHAQKRVDNDRRNGGTGFDRNAYTNGSSEQRQAIDTATNRNKDKK